MYNVRISNQLRLCIYIPVNFFTQSSKLMKLLKHTTIFTSLLYLTQHFLKSSIFFSKSFNEGIDAWRSVGYVRYIIRMVFFPVIIFLNHLIQTSQWNMISMRYASRLPYHDFDFQHKGQFSTYIRNVALTHIQRIYANIWLLKSSLQDWWPLTLAARGQLLTFFQRSLNTIKGC